MSAQLLSLTLAGFRSFPQKTELRLQPGLTALIGDVGSGKSSIVDALAWLLGDPLADMDRGAFVFRGTDRRPAGDAAEIGLRFVPPEGSTAARPFLEITKRIARETDPSFRFDGHAAREKDVLDFLAGAGLTAAAPTILRGASLRALTSATPAELLAMLEQASGIGELSARRREARAKLDSAIAHLRQLDAKTIELGGLIEEARAETTRALRHTTLSRRIHGLNVRVQWHTWRGAERRAEGARMRFKAIAAQLDSRAALREKVNAALNAMRKKVHRAQADLDRARSQLAELQLQRAKAVGDENRIRTTLAHIKARSKESEENVRRQSQILRGWNEIDWPQSTAAPQTGDALPTPKPVDEDSVRAAAAEGERRHREARGALERSAVALAGMLADRDQARLRVERLALLQECRQELKRAEADAPSSEKTAQKMEAARRELKAASNLAREARRLRESKARRLAEARAGQERLAERLATLHGQITGHCTELAVFETLLPSISSDRSQAQEKTPQGRLAELLDPDPRLALALQAAIGPEIAASTSVRDAEYWSGKTGAVGLYLPEGARPLNELIDAPEWLGRRLSQCGLIRAEDGPRLQEQLQQGQCLVSLEGDMWRWDGLVRRAEPKHKIQGDAGQGSDLRSRHGRAERRLLEARDELRELRAGEKGTLDEFERLERDVRDAEAAEERALARLRVANEALIPVEREDEYAQRTEGNSRTNRELIDKMAAACREPGSEPAPPGDERDIAPVGEESAREQVLEARRMLERASEHRIGIAVSVERARERAQLAALLQTRDKRDAARIEKIKSAFAALCGTMEKRASEISTALSGLARESTAAEKELRGILDRIATIDRSIAAGGETVSKAEHKLAALVAECMANEEKALDAAREDSNQAELRQAEAQLEGALAEVERIEKAAGAEFGTDLAGLGDLVRALPAEIDDPMEVTADNVETAHAMLAELRSQAEALGEVDREAAGGLERLEAQLRETVNEREDLAAAVERVRGSLESLAQTMNQRLRERIEPTQNRFATLFRALSGGGEASVRLVDGDDDTSPAGLELEAAPPGRKRIALRQLSASEQFLTAIAFQFTLFLWQPSPLCVVEQIEESLDQEHRQRLARLLRELAKTAQSRIVLVGRDQSLAKVADYCTGVFMDEPGVSRLRRVERPAADSAAA